MLTRPLFILSVLPEFLVENLNIPQRKHKYFVANYLQKSNKCEIVNTASYHKQLLPNDVHAQY